MSKFQGSKTNIQVVCRAGAEVHLVKYTESGGGGEKEHGKCNNETLFQNVIPSAETRNIRNFISQSFPLIFFEHVQTDLSRGKEFPGLNNTVWRNIPFYQS